MDLKPGSHIHLMGICGTAMASLAGLFKDRGFHVTGSDSNPYPPMSTQIENLGIQIQKGYKKENLQPRPDFVIVGNVISANNEEAMELMKLQIPYTSLPKAIGEMIIAERQSIVVSGTHGKTTTTSLMSWIADQCGKKPGFLIGGIPKNFSQSFRNPAGDLFVIEGDEYDTAFFDKVPKFTHYKPRHVIFTSVEFDHADIYADFEAVKVAFRTLVKSVPENGTLIYWADDRNVKEIATKTIAKKCFGYGLNGGDYKATVLSISETSTDFEVHFQGKLLGRFKMKMTGSFNVLNATADIAMAHQLGFDLSQVEQAVQSFEGVKRRQEILGEPGGVLIIEDFAHHPTAVRETVSAIRKKYQSRKLFSVFEPRSATSRRKVFQKDYVEAFKDSDEILIARAFDQSKIDEGNRFSSDELISDLKLGGKSAESFDNAAQIVDRLRTQTSSGDIVLIMSNGGFDGIYGKLIQALETR